MPVCWRAAGVLFVCVGGGVVQTLWMVLGTGSLTIACPPVLLVANVVFYSCVHAVCRCQHPHSPPHSPPLSLPPATTPPHPPPATTTCSSSLPWDALPQRMLGGYDVGPPVPVDPSLHLCLLACTRRMRSVHSSLVDPHTPGTHTPGTHTHTHAHTTRAFLAFGLATLLTSHYLLFRLGFEYCLGGVYSVAALAMLRLLIVVHVSLLEGASSLTEFHLTDPLQGGGGGAAGAGAGATAQALPAAGSKHGRRGRGRRGEGTSWRPRSCAGRLTWLCMGLLGGAWVG